MLLGLLLLGLPSQVLAEEPCDGGGLTERGRCVGHHAVEWCSSDGRHELFACADGDICALGTDSRGLEKGFTCIARAATECASISDDGECPSLGRVVWCVDGRAESFPCAPDTECGWDASGQTYDCVAKGRIPTGDDPPEAVEGAEVSEGSDAGGPESAELPRAVPGGPTPQVNPGQNFAGGGGGGCSAGSGGAPRGATPLAWLACLLGAAWVRRFMSRA